MSTQAIPQQSSSGVVRIGRKGIKKFAFGEEGAPFEVDVVVAFQEWIAIDDQFRQNDAREIALADMRAYHEAARSFVNGLAGGVQAEQVLAGDPMKFTPITTAEALDFLARLREEYDALVVFFRPRLRDEPDSPASSAAELKFSEEES